MNPTLLNIGVIVFIIYAVVFIAYITTLIIMSLTLRKFIKKTQENLNPVLIEMAGSLQNIKRISENINIVSRDVRFVADSVVNLEEGFKKVYGNLKENIVATAAANVSGLKAGVKTGVVTLMKNLKL